MGICTAVDIKSGTQKWKFPAGVGDHLFRAGGAFGFISKLQRELHGVDITNGQ